MKAVIFFLTVVFFCFLKTGISHAQSTSDKSDGNLFFSVECDGVQDFIFGTTSEHLLTHMSRAGDINVVKDQFIGKELVSLVTGEEFRVNYTVKPKIIVPGILFQISEHFNLVGDQGTHILYSRITLIDLTSGYLQSTVVKEKTECL